MVHQLAVCVLLIQVVTVLAGSRVGAWAEDITPRQWPISLAGSMVDQIATTAHDRIHARAMVFDDGNMKIAVICCDSCMIPRETIDAAKAAIHDRVGIPPANVLVSATHSHSCPTSTGIFQSEPDPTYREFLIDRIVASVEKAVAELAPCEIGIGKSECPNAIFNRRWHMRPGSIPPDPFGNTTDLVQMNPPSGSPNLIQPAGPIDPDVYVLAARSPDHVPRALFANYSLHYVGGIPPGQVSADYFGAFCERIASQLATKDSSGVHAILTNGTSGDINNIDFRFAQPPTEPFVRVRLVATLVAEHALQAYHAASFHPEARLATAVRELELGVRRPTRDEVARAREILSAAGDRPLRTLQEIYARETILLADYPPTVKMVIQVLRIGPAAVVAIPCEVFAEIGLELKKKSPVPTTFVVELANGYNGYLPTPEQHQLGGYETWRARSSYLEVVASTRITEAALDLLQETVGRE